MTHDHVTGLDLLVALPRLQPAPLRAAPHHGRVLAVADLMCPVHGVNGTEPGDGYWDEDTS